MQFNKVLASGEDEWPDWDRFRESGEKGVQVECCLKPLGLYYLEASVSITDIKLLGLGRETCLFSVHLLASSSGGLPIILPRLQHEFRNREEESLKRSRSLVRDRGITTKSFSIKSPWTKLEELIGQQLIFKGGSFKEGEQCPQLDMFLECSEGLRQWVVGGCPLRSEVEFTSLLISRGAKVAGRVEARVQSTIRRKFR